MTKSRILISGIAIGLLIAAGAASMTPRKPEPIRITEQQRSGALPNDCAIVATEAAARLRNTGAWHRLLVFGYVNLVTGEIRGHALAVWQPIKDSRVFAYDSTGSFELETSSRELKDIAAQLGIVSGCMIVNAHFVE